MDTNGYIVFDEFTKDAIIIDPGAEENKFIDFIENEGLKPYAVILTHAHFDHIGAVSEIKRHFNIPLMICSGEEQVLENKNINMSAIYSEPIELKADRIFKDGEYISLGSLLFKVIITPGHTPGGGCFYFEEEKVLFSGDTLFCMSIGRSDFLLGSESDLINSIKNKLMILPDDVEVFSGHGPKTSIGYERKNNFFVR